VCGRLAARTLKDGLNAKGTGHARLYRVQEAELYDYEEQAAYS